VGAELQSTPVRAATEVVHSFRRGERFVQHGLIRIEEQLLGQLAPIVGVVWLPSTESAPSLNVQAGALSSLARNGLYLTTDAHQFVLQ
jgi:hypothetical protein